MTNQQRYDQQNQWNSNWRNPQYRRISMEEAIGIALRRVPGHAVKAELEYDDGLLIYEINIRTREGQKYEVKVDANTGAILRVKRD
ncbi:PepSY domain-containing protein [Sporosarcina sp. HYO08]|uniref:PepSY domain-containing protein n=1 Tax=Sporosarcina sp. HYO08 TaxID=1759557 RepID=UPI000792A640|nr:PepSY domain-containing protein [Sporosarcina sp. HYO08]KXH87083.1 hypothetical protein AU377_00440 [Sporosarcina sp. HYO08]